MLGSIRDQLCVHFCVAAACAVVAAGCGTTRTSNTIRTATEQLLISDAIDRSVQQIDFRVLEGQPVFLEERLLAEAVDKSYLISSLRQQLLACGCVLKEKREDAIYIVEPRVGAMGTDNHGLLFGIPAVQVPQVGLAPISLPASLPEIPFAKRDDQRGVAKLAVFAYRRDTGQPVWQSGIALSESESNNIWLFGAGPFKRGTIYEGSKFAGAKIKGEEDSKRPKGVAAVGERAVFAGAPNREEGKPAQHTDGAVMQASAQAPTSSTPKEVGPPVLPPPKPISQAPKPEDPAKTAG
jgi:hypothetical protein